MTVRGNDSSKIQPNPCISGTGLSDGYPPGGVDAHEVRSIYAAYLKNWYLTRICLQSNKFLERLPYDVMSIGKCVKPPPNASCQGTDDFTRIATNYTSMPTHMICGSWIFWAHFCLTDGVLFYTISGLLLCYGLSYLVLPATSASSLWTCWHLWEFVCDSWYFILSPITSILGTVRQYPHRPSTPATWTNLSRSSQIGNRIPK